MTKLNKNTKAFSLVELSIVLVIIGLIIGGVLVGQQLIAAASIRSAVSQFDKYSSATNVFFTKYGAFPGDFNNAIAALGSPVEGDGNGVITAAAPYTFGGEQFGFWDHLSRAQLIQEPITHSTATVIVGGNIPKLKLGSPESGIIPHTYHDFNYFRTSILSGNVDFYNDPVLGLTLTPEQAFGIDSKIDDGIATTGMVLSAGQVDIIFSGSSTCNNTSTGVYVLSNKTPSCALRIEFRN